MNTGIRIDDVKIPMNKNKKILGVTLDPLLRAINQQEQNLKEICEKQPGKEKETLVSTYKTIGQGAETIQRMLVKNGD